MTGAHEQNLACIGVAWGYEVKESMQAAGAEKIIESPEELLEYLRG